MMSDMSCPYCGEERCENLWWDGVCGDGVPMKWWTISIPVPEEISFVHHTVFEHTPLDYYKYGEYPRFISPVGWHRHRVLQIEIRAKTRKEALEIAMRDQEKIIKQYGVWAK